MPTSTVEKGCPPCFFADPFEIFPAQEGDRRGYRDLLSEVGNEVCGSISPCMMSRTLFQKETVTPFQHQPSFANLVFEQPEVFQIAINHVLCNGLQQILQLFQGRKIFQYSMRGTVSQLA